MKRITVAEVQEAYSTTGLKPQPNDLLDCEEADEIPTCGCGLGALYLANAGTRGLHATVSDAAMILGLEKFYAYGFSDGFDGGYARGASSWGLDPSDEQALAYELGHADGKAAGDLMLGR